VTESTLQQQSFHHSRTATMEKCASRPQTARLVMRPIHTATEDVLWGSETTAWCELCL